MAERRRFYLDDVLLVERLGVATAHTILRELATSVHLPGKLRNECAQLALRLGRLGRDLAALAQQRTPEPPAPEEPQP